MLDFGYLYALKNYLSVMTPMRVLLLLLVVVVFEGE